MSVILLGSQLLDAVRNPDQVDVIDQMNEQMMQGINQLASLASGLQPNEDERRCVQIENAITSSLERMN